MNLYLLRHGIAVERSAASYPDDSKRPLTPKGKRKLRRSARAMERLGIFFDAILCSPYVRAWETAELVAEILGRRSRPMLCEALVPAGSVKALVATLNRVRPRPKSVLLVGHEPYLSTLIGLFVGGDSGLSIVLKKGGLCRLSSDKIESGRCATLEWLLTPKQMEAISERDLEQD